MGTHSNITTDSFPQQGLYHGRRVTVIFHRDTQQPLLGTVVRDDIDEPFETNIQLDDGRFVRGVECQYRQACNDSPNSFVPTRPQDARSALRMLVDALIPVPGSSCNGAQRSPVAAATGATAPQSERRQQWSITVDLARPGTELTYRPPADPKKVKDSWRQPEKYAEITFDCSLRRLEIRQIRLRKALFVAAAASLQPLIDDLRKEKGV